MSGNHPIDKVDFHQWHQVPGMATDATVAAHLATRCATIGCRLLPHDKGDHRGQDGTRWPSAPPTTLAVGTCNHGSVTYRVWYHGRPGQWHTTCTGTLDNVRSWLAERPYHDARVEVHV